jgi:lysophospholipase L1-like esterase
VFLLRRLLLICVGTAIAVLTAEAGLRIAGGIPEVANPLYSFHESDPVLGWRGKRNAQARFHRPDFDALIEHGPDGWRRPRPDTPAQPVRRVLVLGDSFTWGWGVSQGEVFTDRLQQRLGPTLAVMNRGVNAFGTAQEYLLLEHELAIQPIDLVLLMFFQNDVADNIDPKSGRRPLFALDGERLVPRNQPPRPLLNPVVRFLKDHSRAYQLLDFQINRLVRAADRDDETAPVRDRGGAPIDYRTLPGAAVTIRLLEAMRALAAVHGARFAIAYIPQRSEIERPDAPVPYIAAVHALVREVAAAQSIPLVDLTAPLRDHAAHGDAVIYPHDEHWTATGHAVAADALLASGLFAFDARGGGE